MTPPDRQHLLAFLRRPAYRPLRIRALARAMRVHPAHYRAFRRMVEAMVAAGEIIEMRHRRFALPDAGACVTGRLHAHQGGFGFVTPESGDPDIFVGRRAMGQALHGDSVLVRLFERRRGLNPEGKIVRVLERGRAPVTGVYRRDGPDGVVIPDDSRIPRPILIPPEYAMGAQAGHKVVAHITDWQPGAYLPLGRVTAILGFPDDPGLEMTALIRSYDLPLDFPDPVLEEAERLPGVLPDEAYHGRQDLRAARCFTIDPAAARDFDDAVSIERLPDGRYRLGVHIADVSAYVREGSLIDREALYRGTSVYLADRVIPMLPPRLTNQLCSLKPGVDRLTRSVWMDIDAAGAVRHFSLRDSVIKSVRRMTYEEAQELIDRGDEEDPVVGDLRHLHDLSRLLLARRTAQGSLDFDLPEAQVLLDETGTPFEVRREERLASHRLIEECMLAANRTVAGELRRRGAPALYRIHGRPAPMKLAELQRLLAGFGYRLSLDDVTHPKRLQQFLDSVRDHPDYRIVNTLVVRAMKKARYAVDDVGHYGLAFETYTHFTSPIRRYPDLVVHRLVQAHQADLSGDRNHHSDKALREIAETASRREKTAEEAERASIRLKQAEYMERHIDEEYAGIISGATGVGFFVELEDSLIDGLVRADTLHDDYYRFDPDRCCLTGERTGRVFRLGDGVRIRVVRADRRLRRIDFELIEHAPSPGRGKPESPPRRAPRRGRRSTATAARRPRRRRGRSGRRG